jgi:hypothetical protein
LSLEDDDNNDDDDTGCDVIDERAPPHPSGSPSPLF